MTDRDGYFAMAPPFTIRNHDILISRNPRFELFFFADESFHRVAYRLVDSARGVPRLEVKLEPTRRVRIPFAQGSIAATPGVEISTEITFAPRPDMPGWIFITRQQIQKQQGAESADQAYLEEYLPAGTYTLEVSVENAAGGLGQAHCELVVPRGEGPFELPPLVLGQSEFKKMAGKPAPEIEATDLDTGRPVKLADYRGKVVVLDFWGYWCGPCTGNMPHLMELQRKFEGQPLAIIALHDQSVQSRAEYDQKISMARQRKWGGRDLTFQVLLDRPDLQKPADRDPIGSGTTVRRYGIEGFPTLFVIDPDGLIVAPVSFADHDRLETIVREQLAKVKVR